MYCLLQTQTKMSHRNYGLISLWDMYRFDAAGYHKAIAVVTEAIAILSRMSPQIQGHVLTEQITADRLANIRELQIAVEPMNVPATKIAIQEFESRLRGLEQYPATLHYVLRMLSEISETLRRELKATHVFVLDSAKAAYYEPIQPHFGAEVASRFPGLAYDITEAGKCLALERSTAAAFHALRSLEGGISAMSRCLGIADPTKGAERNWNAMLTKIKAEIDRRWPSGAARFSGEGKTFEELYAALAALQNPYRNATMHFDHVYTPEDARHVFDIVGGLLRKIASRMNENGDPNA
jgi:hypothetical protein